ncbi:hypothetical protein FRACYDRAFT_261490 [Fragilariopsis cylindrus CCMP1102]|uniref:Uncharacterized protein n=1 Tax=Fragilariopsis cylindrus CCMP1102 TaxID=635003 RepID=A0A1E7FA75_9STRA|nr:hypothetical protein FRACYDRAFT_261490 [Fragilariopsis cylindrus CCMP1102]|eukprot:OEU15039.1 hypothetical protein FRACYDRAFT_261490 [Fragilariopsis cylindrus CCMP1102]
MNGETFFIDPELVVIFGFRSTISLVGLITGVVGYWLSERKWDNEGSSALKPDRNNDGIENNNNNDEAGESGGTGVYLEMNNNDPNKVVGYNFHNNGARDLVRVRTDDSNDNNRYHPGESATKNTENIQSIEAAKFYGTPEVVRAHLYTAYPLPKLMIVGLCIWNISFLLDPSIGGIRFYANFCNISSFLLSATLGPIWAFLWRNATLERDIETKKRIALSFVVLSLLLCVVTIVDPMVSAPWYFNVFGVFFILASSVVFSLSRKMGFTSWDLKGKPKTNTNVYVQNLGPLLLIFGVFLFWVGTNAVSMADLNQNYIPFWTTNTRGCFVFIAGMILIVPGTLALDLAFDEGSLPVVPGFRDVIVYRLDGNTFTELIQKKFTKFDLSWMARLLETPLLGSIGWLLMGLCSFLPFGVTELTIQKFCTMAVCFSVAAVQFLLVTPALWKSDEKAYTKWIYVYYGLMASLGICIGVASGIALLLSIFAIGLILAGQRKDMYDERKRGHMWLTGTPPTINPDPQVYGLGQPIYLLGWIMLCTAMSIPM